VTSSKQTSPLVEEQAPFQNTQKSGKNNKNFWEELVYSYFHLIRHGCHTKRRLQQFFFATGTFLANCYVTTIGGYTERPTDSRLIRHESHRKWCIETILILLLVFTAAGTCLPSRCLATRGIHVRRHREWWEGFMKYAFEICSGAMIYITSFIKFGSGI
jgi:hypothetical protein